MVPVPGMVPGSDGYICVASSSSGK